MTTITTTDAASTRDVLAALGYQHCATGATGYAHDVVAPSGEIIFTGNCFEVNDWLHETNQWLIAPTCQHISYCDKPADFIDLDGDAFCADHRYAAAV
jgi:hypothetical protein